MTIVMVTVFFAETGFGYAQKISKLSVADITSADVGESWISVAGTGASLGTITLEIKFNDEEQLRQEVTIFESASDGTAQFYSLQDVVTQINIASLNPDSMYDPWGNPMAYTAAYIIDSTVTPGEYSLKIISRERTTLPMEFFTTSSANAVLSGNFGSVGTDLTGDNTYFFAAVEESGTYSGGDGSAGNPFLISDANDMNEIGAEMGDWDKHFLLTNDIDMAGFTYTTALIAPDTSSSSDFQGTKFTGVFDGAGFKITNLTIDTAGTDYLGLFGYIDSTGMVNNLGAEDVNIAGGNHSVLLAGLCGLNSGTISDCYSTGLVTGGDYSGSLGELVGVNSGTISNCFSTGQVTITGGNHSECLGGLAGINVDGTISNCFSTGQVTGGNDSFAIGGLCGYNAFGAIKDCYSTGSVTGGDYSNSLGGLAGYNYYGTISDCYSTSSVTGGDESTRLGGLAGYSDNGTISNCFWDIDTSGLDTSAGGIGKTTIEMQTMSTFTDAGWDFVGETINGPNDFWDICEDVIYPRLGLLGDFAEPNGVDFVDFAFFANYWQETGCDGTNIFCNHTDIDRLGTVDFSDLYIFTENWLMGLE
jgi:hypothetical protein